MGLLVTPSGIRIPYYKPFYTKPYCTEKNRPHRTQAEIAAEMIVELDLPETPRVIVLGDTAFDAKVIREACSKRNFTWIVPINPERVLAGPKPRPKVCSLVEKICIQKLACIKVQAGVGKYVNYRRVSKCRIGPKIKPRMYYMHE